jgi:hypothetical protein
VDDLVFTEAVDVEPVHARRPREIDKDAVVRVKTIVLTILV